MTIRDLWAQATARMPTAAITLKVYCGGMRWRLADADKVEVWRGTTLVGTLTGRTLNILIEHQLLAAEVHGWVQATITSPPELAAAAPRKPPAAAPPRVAFTSDERAAQKARRRTRRRA